MYADSIGEDKIALLQEFVKLCKTFPDILHSPKLKFFVDWIESLGGKIPPPVHSKHFTGASASKPGADETKTEGNEEEKSSSEVEEDDAESDLELDNTGVIEPDNDPPLPLGDKDKEVTPEIEAEADELRSQAQAKLADGDMQGALDLFTQAIEKHASAILFAKRASILVKMNKPNAAIRDCNEALSINEFSQQALKWRGRAYRLLGKWNEAYLDFCKAQETDFDDQVAEWIKEVEPNAHKITEHNRKKERKLEEKREKERLARVKKAREEYEKQKTRPSEAAENLNFDNPELFADMNDPEIMQAFLDIGQNPANIMKYQNNPKVMQALKKIQAQFGEGKFSFPNPPS